MKRCAIYARYSSDLQSPTSIDDQVQLCRAYADRQGWVIITTFHDAALSGFGVEHRPGYQQLVAAAGATPPGFDTILVERWAHSRTRVWMKRSALPFVRGV
jgi:site-specific DNA recombinase